MLRLSAGAWSAVTPSFPLSSGNIVSTWMSPTGAIYVSGDNFFYKYESAAWTQLSALPKLTQLEAVSATEIYGISNGTSVVRFNGTSWTTVFTSPWPLSGGGSAAGKAVFVGQNGVVIEGK